LNLSRQLLQTVATSKLEDAVLLLAHDRYSNAYYLAGYAVEIALKAVIAKQFRPGVIPEKGLVNSIYTHRLISLIDLAGLSAELGQARNVLLAAKWTTVSQWSEASRYETISEAPARELVTAVNDPKGGVSPWIIRHW
jgi:HEPN domain-containing protein